MFQVLCRLDKKFRNERLSDPLNQEIGMIKCRRCKKDYPENQVTVWKQGSARTLTSICRICVTKKAREYRATEKGRKAILEASRRAYIKHKDKWIARAKANYAVKMGKLIKPEQCEVCLKKTRLEGHHEDYSKPLEIIWLCTGCHADTDRELENKKPNPLKSNLAPNLRPLKSPKPKK